MRVFRIGLKGKPGPVKFGAAHVWIREPRLGGGTSTKRSRRLSKVLNLPVNHPKYLEATGRTRPAQPGLEALDERSVSGHNSVNPGAAKSLV